MSHTTNTSTHCVIHEEKERERMGIELNEQREKNIYEYHTTLLGFRCVSVKILRWFLLFFSFFVLLSECVRVTVRAGASLSLSLSLASERLAKGNYQLTDQQAGLGRLVIG